MVWQCCWRCVKVKLINLVFISWHCLCLPQSHAPTKQHRRANSYPETLQTAPQAKCTRRVLGAAQEAKARLITSLTSVFTNRAQLDLYRQLSALIGYNPVLFGGVRHVSSHSPPRQSSTSMCRRIVRRLETKVRVTLLVFQKVQQQLCVEWNPKTGQAFSIAVSYSLFRIESCCFIYLLLED